MGFAKRTDKNQSNIVQTLRKMGCKVFITSQVGFGFVDIVVAVNDKVLKLIEIKDGDKPPSAQKLTEAEQKFHLEWKAHVYIIKSIQDAVDFVNLHREMK